MSQSIDCEICAFFDVDGTILKITSLKSFQITKHQYIYGHSKRCGQELDKIRTTIKTLREAGHSREYINKKYYQFFKNESKKETQKIAAIWWQNTLKNTTPLFINETVEKLKNHQKHNHRIALVSGSFIEILSPIAEYFGINHIIATNLEVKNGLYTGNIAGFQTIGKGKRDAIMQFAAKEKLDLNQCHAYGDHISDLPMLELVGYPNVIIGHDKDAELDKIACQKGWNRIICK